MPDPKGYVAVLVTFSGTTSARLYDKAVAIDSACPQTCRSFNITSDPNNGAAGTYLLLGDSAVSTTRYGQILEIGSSRLYPPSSNPPFAALYGLPAYMNGTTLTAGATGSAVIAIEVIRD